LRPGRASGPPRRLGCPGRSRPMRLTTCSVMPRHSCPWPRTHWAFPASPCSRCARSASGRRDRSGLPLVRGGAVGLDPTGRGGAIRPTITGRGGAVGLDPTGRGGAIRPTITGRGGAVGPDPTGRAGAIGSEALDRAACLGVEHAPADQFLSEVNGRLVIDNRERAQVLL